MQTGENRAKQFLNKFSMENSLMGLQERKKTIAQKKKSEEEFYSERKKITLLKKY